MDIGWQQPLTYTVHCTDHRRKEKNKLPETTERIPLEDILRFGPVANLSAPPILTGGLPIFLASDRTLGLLEPLRNELLAILFSFSSFGSLFLFDTMLL